MNRSKKRILLAVSVFTLLSGLGVAAKADDTVPAAVRTPAAQQIKVNETAITLTEKQVDRLVVTLLPQNASQAVTFSSSNPRIVTVDASGSVHAIATGDAVITIAVPNTPLTLKVPVHVNEIVIPQKMYRLYNPNSGEHFYTADTNERNSLVFQSKWYFEGTGWVAPTHSKTPVYRLYNKNAGDHQYTTNTGERDHLRSLGWRYEGIGWYSDDNQSVKVLRAYNKNAKAGSHNYTTNNSEQQNLIQNHWRDEGIGWYAVGAGEAANPAINQALINQTAKNKAEHDKKVAEDEALARYQRSLPGKMVAWFQSKKGKTTYSMSNRWGPKSYDCSSAMYTALLNAGGKPLYTRASITTLNEGQWLGTNGFKLVYRGSKYGFKAQKGDVFVFDGAGEAGHTGIFIDEKNIIHSTWYYRDFGIVVTNFAQRFRVPSDHHGTISIYRHDI
ncbi:peptidoglycan amidohydrolase family protein [Lactococcus insecticola]|uniref:BIG2 domain-containing protein n=1 Tax=Pseudolactococcus insecticola TaxID=2709158 RepID=A0A6A0B6W1_9LACT|nr:peptidoglycan amidohydrolase family protein [Lactococcus insecticola]GFH41002.1 hypothetical protein Hs20B_14000 [Lactococcus insecticola]